MTRRWAQGAGITGTAPVGGPATVPPEPVRPMP